MNFLNYFLNYSEKLYIINIFDLRAYLYAAGKIINYRFI